MPYVVPTVSFSTVYDGTFTTITGIQSVQINRGRKYFQDNFSASSCTIEIIPQDAGGVAAPMPIVGQWLEVRVPGGVGAAYFNGRVTDVNRTYGYPYNGTSKAAPADRVTITATGPTGMLGTSDGVETTLVGDWPVTAATSQIGTINNVPCAQFGASNPTLIKNGLYSNYKAFDLINQLLRTGQSFIDDYDGKRTLSPRMLLVTQPSGGIVPTFTDNGTTGTNIYKFRQIEFGSSVQTAFTQVAVAATGLATQYAQTGSAPYATLNYQTLNATTTTAASLATYLLNLNGQTSATPLTLSADTFSASDVMKVAELFTYTTGQDFRGCPLGTQVTVIFRGATSYGQIQGITASFYPDHGSVSLSLSTSFGTPFTLNSTAFGVLGTNRLGFP